MGLIIPGFLSTGFGAITYTTLPEQVLASPSAGSELGVCQFEYAKPGYNYTVEACCVTATGQKCWVAKITSLDPMEFTYQVSLPAVDTSHTITLEDGPVTGNVTGTFRTALAEHEAKHIEIYHAVSEATFGKFQTWAEKFVTLCGFLTPQEAEAALDKDILAGWNQTEAAFKAFDWDAGGHGAGAALATVVDGNWTAGTLDWADVQLTNAGNLNFAVTIARTPGDPACPEPGPVTLSLALFGSAATHWRQRRRAAQMNP